MLLCYVLFTLFNAFLWTYFTLVICCNKFYWINLYGLSNKFLWMENFSIALNAVIFMAFPLYFPLFLLFVEKCWISLCAKNKILTEYYVIIFSIFMTQPKTLNDTFRKLISEAFQKSFLLKKSYNSNKKPPHKIEMISNTVNSTQLNEN